MCNCNYSIKFVIQKLFIIVRLKLFTSAIVAFSDNEEECTVLVVTTVSERKFACTIRISVVLLLFDAILQPPPTCTHLLATTCRMSSCSLPVHPHAPRWRPGHGTRRNTHMSSCRISLDSCRRKEQPSSVLWHLNIRLDFILEKTKHILLLTKIEIMSQRSFKKIELG